MLCLTFVFSTTTPTTYAGDLGLRVDTHNLNTVNSWFQPYVERKVTGRSYAWTVTGPVYFTKESGKWPGGYFDGGGLPWMVPVAAAKVYRSSYIKGAKLILGWAYLDPGVSALNLKHNNQNMHYETYEFGDTSGTGSVEVDV